MKTKQIVITTLLLLLSSVSFSQHYNRDKYQDTSVINTKFLYKMLSQTKEEAAKNYDFYASHVQDTNDYTISLGRDFQFQYGFRNFYEKVVGWEEIEEITIEESRESGGGDGWIFVLDFYKKGESTYFNGVAFCVKNNQIERCMMNFFVE
ncbi:MAG: hypothetical protein ACLGGV_00300 [Bacteroidia bacterium]